MRWRYLAALLLAGLTGCTGDGHFTLLGYSSRPNYDSNIKTVYVPIPETRSFRREVEFELQKAIVRAIEDRTPYKVTSDCNRADTKLVVSVATYTKGLVNRNQLNEVREAEWVLTADVTWTDLRSGEILSQPRGGSRTPAPPPFDPDNPPPPDVKPKAQPVRITSTARELPELGESWASAQKLLVDRMGIQITQMMESPWSVDCGPNP